MILLSFLQWVIIDCVDSILRNSAFRCLSLFLLVYTLPEYLLLDSAGRVIRFHFIL